MSPTSAEFDVVLFGATGVLGTVVAEHLARYAPEETRPPRIALAGRRTEAVRAVRDALGRRAQEWGVLTVDASDAASVDDLARRSRVVVSTVGPYAPHGLALLGACARHGTHYADVSGEVLFIAEAARRHHEAARSSGACLVPAAGFDSVPSDAAVHLVARQVRDDDAGTVADATGYWRILRGGVSRGTFASLVGQLDATRADPVARAVVADPYALSPDRDAEPEARDAPADLPRLTPGWDPQLPGWVAPYVMAGINTQVVRRTNALTGWAYGRGLRYREVLDTGRANTAPVKALAWSLIGPAFVVSRVTAPTRALADRLLRALPSGPSRVSRDRGRFRLETRATTTTGARYVATAEAHLDPAIGATSVMLGETALALAAAAQNDLPGGVHTPMSGLGDVLVKRLRSRGFRLVARRV